MHNDGVDNPAALYIELRIKNRFSAQLTNLFKTASEKQVLPGLRTLYQGQIEDEQELAQQEGNEEGQNEGTNVPEHDVTYVEESSLHNTTTHEDIPEDLEQSGVEIVGEGSIQFQEQSLEHSYDETRDTEPQREEVNEQEEITYDDQEKHHEQSQVEEENASELQPEFAEDVEQGEGSSSGSSTVQGETDNQTARGYTSPVDEEELLINYSDEETDHDATFDTVLVNDGLADEQTVPDAKQQEDSELDATVQVAEDTFDFGGEQQHASFDDSTFDADTFNQEFTNYGVDFEYNGGTQDQTFNHDQAHQDWPQEDAPPPVGSALMTASGTFQVPSASEDDEDEITFDEDELTVDDVETQDAAVEEQAPHSPLGKRSREEDGEDALDGSDQGSPKRARLSPA
jgi:hypothetical protein